jgi:prepilin-type N-terminal cleavage/methylation domain-containing protein
MSSHGKELRRGMRRASGPVSQFGDAERFEGECMTRTRRGFSLPELMVVISIIGILTLMAMPKIRSFRSGNNLRSAKAQVASSLATARAAAIQKGRDARFIVQGNNLAVAVDTGSASGFQGYVVLSNVPLADRYSASITLTNAADSVVSYDSRGFGSTGSGVQAKYILRVQNFVDSVCVSQLGLINKRGCGA